MYAQLMTSTLKQQLLAAQYVVDRSKQGHRRAEQMQQQCKSFKQQEEEQAINCTHVCGFGESVIEILTGTSQSASSQAHMRTVVQQALSASG